MRRVRVHELEVGDRFVESPPPWYGEGQILAIDRQPDTHADYPRLSFACPLWRLEFEAPVNEPPGVLYLDPNHYVVLLEPADGLVRGPWERAGDRSSAYGRRPRG
jgi:hypothetical protein